MLEQIPRLWDEILQAPPEVVVPAALFVFLGLIRLVLALPGRTRAVEDDGLEAEAHSWIAERIDEHLDALAEAYGKVGTRAEDDELPPGFAATIESFIAEVLLRERDPEDFDVDLGVAVREFVVLHRAELYADVTTRVRNHLAAV